jgi:hypothetical protein
MTLQPSSSGWVAVSLAKLVRNACSLIGRERRNEAHPHETIHNYLAGRPHMMMAESSLEPNRAWLGAATHDESPRAQYEAQRRVRSAHAASQTMIYR